MTLRFYMPAGRYEKDEEMSRRVEDVVRRLEALPEVEAALTASPREDRRLRSR